MSQPQSPSDQAKELFLDAYKDFLSRNREKALAKLEALLKNTDNLGEDKYLYLYYRKIWARTIDPGYTPPMYFDEADVYPLNEKRVDHAASGNFQEALHYAWLYLQYCAAGTHTFL